MLGSRITLAPPASARSHSPARRLWQARCTATSEDEHAVSMVRLGPRRSRKYDRRPDGRSGRYPVVMWKSTPSGSAKKRSSKSPIHMPTNTPVADPATSLRGTPASSSASHAVSSSSRCCGSRRSPRAGRCRRSRRRAGRRPPSKPPRALTIRPGVAGRRVVTASPRRSDRTGSSPMASKPSRSRRQKRVGTVGAAGETAADADDGDRRSGRHARCRLDAASFSRGRRCRPSGPLVRRPGRSGRPRTPGSSRRAPRPAASRRAATDGGCGPGRRRTRAPGTAPGDR